MATDDLGTQVSRASAAMVLTQFAIMFQFQCQKGQELIEGEDNLAQKLQAVLGNTWPSQLIVAA